MAALIRPVLVLLGVCLPARRRRDRIAPAAAAASRPAVGGRTNSSTSTAAAGGRLALFTGVGRAAFAPAAAVRPAMFAAGGRARRGARLPAVRPTVCSGGAQKDHPHPHHPHHAGEHAHRSGANHPPQYASQAAFRLAQWGVVTKDLAAASTIAFAVLLLPQLWANTQALATGRPELLAIIAWRG